jgi:hypothetical protein
VLAGLIVDFFKKVYPFGWSGQLIVHLDFAKNDGARVHVKISQNCNFDAKLRFARIAELSNFSRNLGAKMPL